MVKSKRLIEYNGSETMVSVPTAVDSALVRYIKDAVFDSSTETVIVDTYANDITGAPWEALNVVWNKEPKCSIIFNANGGSGSMPTRSANIGIAYNIPQCLYVGPSSAEFSTWAINSIEGSTISPGTQYAFAESTDLYAIWNVPEKWFDNNKDTWADANAEGWYSSGSLITFSGTIDSSSVYNIPRVVAGTEIDKVAGVSYKSFTYIGGKGIKTLSSYAFYSCTSLTEVSFPNCSYIGNCAFSSCSALTTITFSNCSYIGGAAFRNCSKLTTVSFPNCSYISNYAFHRCSTMTTAYFLSTSLVALGSDVFSDCTVLTSIYVPSSLLTVYQSVENWSYYSSKLVAYTE